MTIVATSFRNRTCFPEPDASLFGEATLQKGIGALPLFLLVLLVALGSIGCSRVVTKHETRILEPLESAEEVPCPATLDHDRIDVESRTLVDRANTSVSGSTIVVTLLEAKTVRRYRPICQVTSTTSRTQDVAHNYRDYNAFGNFLLAAGLAYGAFLAGSEAADADSAPARTGYVALTAASAALSYLTWTFVFRDDDYLSSAEGSIHFGDRISSPPETVGEVVAETTVVAPESRAGLRATVSAHPFLLRLREADSLSPSVAVESDEAGRAIVLIGATDGILAAEQLRWEQELKTRPSYLGLSPTLRSEYLDAALRIARGPHVVAIETPDDSAQLPLPAFFISDEDLQKLLENYKDIEHELDTEFRF